MTWTTSMSEIERPPSTRSEDHSEFLCAPTDTDDKRVQQRESAAYISKGTRFKLERNAFDRQFSQNYFCRLLQLRQAVLAQAQTRWPGVKVAKILEVEEGVEVAVIGTLFKEMKLKPRILDEYTKNRGLKGELGTGNRCSDDDKLIIEDEAARMHLTGEALPVGDLVTGVIIAVRGVQQRNGGFEVTAVCYAGIGPQPPLPNLENDKYLAFVSGLAIGGEDTQPLALEILVDYLTGASGGDHDRELSKKIVRLIIAGGSLMSPDNLAKAPANSVQQFRAIEPIKDIDMCLVELAAAMPIDVMPGQRDPASFALPQQPLHRCLFPGASAYTTLNRVTNPHDFEVDGIRVLGTSGQNVDDLAIYSRCTEPSMLMERCLEWRHLAPTAPDTLTCVPFAKEDPFVIGGGNESRTPHIFFAGCQRDFTTNIVQGPDGQRVRVITVPDFSKTGILVLVNLRTLACHPVRFETSALDGP